MMAQPISNMIMTGGNSRFFIKPLSAYPCKAKKHQAQKEHYEGFCGMKMIACRQWGDIAITGRYFEGKKPRGCERCLLEHVLEMGKVVWVKTFLLSACSWPQRTCQHKGQQPHPGVWG
jgi:hypothetical protein